MTHFIYSMGSILDFFPYFVPYELFYSGQQLALWGYIQVESQTIILISCLDLDFLLIFLSFYFWEPGHTYQSDP